MKIDLGDYKYCEESELEELGKIKNKKTIWYNHVVKINGTLFKTQLDNYVFYGRVYDTDEGIDLIRGWKIIPALQIRDYLSLCDFHR